MYEKFMINSVNFFGKHISIDSKTITSFITDGDLSIQDFSTLLTVEIKVAKFRGE